MQSGIESWVAWFIMGYNHGINSYENLLMSPRAVEGGFCVHDTDPAVVGVGLRCFMVSYPVKQTLKKYIGLADQVKIGTLEVTL